MTEQHQQVQSDKTAKNQLESSASQDATGREMDALIAEKVMGYRWRALSVVEVPA